MLARCVDMLGGAAALVGGDHLDQAQALERAHVVGDGAERRVEMLGELHGLESRSSSIARMRTRSGCASAFA